MFLKKCVPFQMQIKTSIALIVHRTAQKEFFHLSFRTMNQVAHRIHHKVVHLAVAVHVQAVIRLEQVMSSFAGSTILITGGSSGIGFALAELLVKRDANVWLLARRQEKLDEAVVQLSKIKKNNEQVILPIQADVSDYKQLSTTLNNVISEYSAPDILINSAGIAYPGEFLNMDPDVFASVININYLGTVYTSKVIAPFMVERGSGYIVNISSLAGVVPIYGYSAYGPSKYAVNAFSEILRTELSPYNIHVAVVYPPDTDTPQLAFENTIKPDITKKITAGGGLLSATQVARVILKGIRMNSEQIAPGFEGKVMRIFPKFIGKVLHILASKQAKNK